MVSPPVKGREDLSSAKVFKILLCWLVEDWVSWPIIPWTISLLCVAEAAKLLKWASKSLAKFVSLGRPGILPRNGAGNVLGLMPWKSWVAAAAPKESSPLAKRVLCLRFLWSGLKVFFQAFHVWSAFGFPYHSGRSLGNTLARRRDNMAKATSQLYVIGRPARLNFLCTSSIVMIN